MPHLRLGLIVNPVAGIGGAVGLKGSDGASLQAQARARGGEPRSAGRARRFLRALREIESDWSARVDWFSPPGDLGGAILSEAGFTYHELPGVARHGDGRDTRAHVTALCRVGVDLLLFVGGDGTARDVLAAARGQLVLGVPSGVKMHSGVFAVSPGAAAAVVHDLLTGALVASMLREVRDFDPDDANGNGLRIRTYGELRVPEAGGFVQHTKQGGKESEPLAVQEICAEVVEHVVGSGVVVLGPGGTLHAVKESLGFAGTLRGVDALMPDGEVRLDLSAEQLEALEGPRQLIVSFTREQGFLFGRGNHQLSALFLQSLRWPDEVCVVGTRTKLVSLQGRPLLVDLDDETLSNALCGLVQIVCGFEDRLLYRLDTRY